MRKSSALTIIVALQLATGGALFAWGSLQQSRTAARLADERELVERLMLTDLALFTEARYTRHLSQADLNTPFQDFPLAMEHFPSGSFAQPLPDHFRQEP